VDLGLGVFLPEPPTTTALQAHNSPMCLVWVDPQPQTSCLVPVDSNTICLLPVSITVGGRPQDLSQLLEAEELLVFGLLPEKQFAELDGLLLRDLISRTEQTIPYLHVVLWDGLMLVPR
jgi:hypothetical protein